MTTPGDEAAVDASIVAELNPPGRPDEAARIVAQCSGCGACLTRSTTGPVCPLLRVQPREEASPRGKVNFIGGILSGGLPSELLLTDEARGILDLCVHCEMCRLICPSRVDVSTLVAAAKAVHVGTNGLDPNDRGFVYADSLLKAARWAGPVANQIFALPQGRWLVEKTLGLSRARRLPRLAGKPFLRVAARRGWTKMERLPGEKAALFVDTFANHFDTGLAEAAVAVLRHNDIPFTVPPNQRPSGVAAAACGAAEYVAAQARKNTVVLGDAVRHGYSIVVLEPAAAYCLKHVYPKLVDDEDARQVAENVFDLSEYLWRIHEQGKLQLDFKPLNLAVGYHTPCRVKALEIGTPGASLLKLIPPSPPHNPGGRRRLLRHGRHLRPPPRRFPHQPPLRLATHLPHARPRHPTHGDRMHRLPDSVGPRRREGIAAPGGVVGEGVRAVGPTSSARTAAMPRRAGFVRAAIRRRPRRLPVRRRSCPHRPRHG